MNTLSQAIFNVAYYSYKMHELTGSMFGIYIIYLYAVVRYTLRNPRCEAAIKSTRMH